MAPSIRTNVRAWKRAVEQRARCWLGLARTCRALGQEATKGAGGAAPRGVEAGWQMAGCQGCASPLRALDVMKERASAPVRKTSATISRLSSNSERNQIGGPGNGVPRHRPSPQAVARGRREPNGRAAAQPARADQSGAAVTPVRGV